MVSTRQMSNCSNSTGEGLSGAAGPSSASHVYTPDLGPAKCTRNSLMAVGAAVAGPVQCYKVQNVPVRALNLLDLPDEVLEKIFGYLPFKEICKARLVCRRVDQISAYILNSTFSKLQNQMLQRFQEIKSKMPRRESARRSHHLACESDIVETLHMRLNLLQMSFGKHIERKHCCFFPGEILDEVFSILHYIKTTPRLDLPYKVTDELFDLSTMAMEYFKEKIEPNLPEIAYFSSDFMNFSNSFASPSSSKYCLEASTTRPSSDASKVDQVDADVLEEEFVEIPQSNMVLRKRIRKIKQGMKRYNSQLTVLRQELKTCKKKTADQQKQITDQQKQLADQQKQTLEYATRLDEYDKKNDEISRKFSTLLQELNKCKTELQYWRCKSPTASSVCNSCGNLVLPEPDEIQALINQGVHPEELGLPAMSEAAASSPNPAQGAANKPKDASVPPIKPSRIPKECSNFEVEPSDPLPEKKAEMSVSSPAPTPRQSKRKSSVEERDDEHQPKKTKRSGKTRCKRGSSKV